MVIIALSVIGASTLGPLKGYEDYTQEFLEVIDMIDSLPPTNASSSSCPAWSHCVGLDIDRN